MENAIKTFVNEKFGTVRTVLIDGEPWFVGKDVATALGYERADNAIRKHIDDEDKLMHQIGASGQNREMYIINESGMYSLILSSRLPNAKAFKRWVTSEVLPAIRKTGGYVGNTDMFVENYLPFADDAVKNLFRLNLITINQLNARIRHDEPLVEFANQVTESDNLIDMGAKAKLARAENIPLGRNRLYGFLRERGVLMSNNLPYQEYVERGYFSVKESTYESNDIMKTYQQTLVTGKGQRYIVGLLKKEFREVC